MTEESAADAAGPPAPVMEWSRFVGGWATTHHGFDLRHAGPLAQRWVRCAYHVGGFVLRNGARQASMTATALAAALFVPAFASQGGRWPLIAAALLVLGLVADTAADAIGVMAGRASRLIGFYRTLVDRVAELCWLLAALLLGGSSMLVGTCGALVLVHEYVRLRATVGGMRPAGTNTVGDRPTRAIATLIMLVVAGAAAGVDQDLAAGTTTLLLAVWTLLALFGLVQLLSIVRKTLR